MTRSVSIALALLTLTAAWPAHARDAVEDDWWQTAGRDRRFAVSTGTDSSIIGTGSHLAGPLWTLEASTAFLYWFHPMLALELSAKAGMATDIDLSCDGGSGLVARTHAGLRFELPIHITPVAGIALGWNHYSGSWHTADCGGWFSDSGPTNQKSGSIRVDGLSVEAKLGVAFRWHALSVSITHDVFVSPLQVIRVTGEPSTRLGDSAARGIGTNVQIGWRF